MKITNFLVYRILLDTIHVISFRNSFLTINLRKFSWNPVKLLCDYPLLKNSWILKKIFIKSFIDLHKSLIENPKLRGWILAGPDLKSWPAGPWRATKFSKYFKWLGNHFFIWKLIYLDLCNTFCNNTASKKKSMFIPFETLRNSKVSLFFSWNFIKMSWFLLNCSYIDKHQNFKKLFFGPDPAGKS